MIQKRYNRERFFKANPKLVGVSGGCYWYEHPTLGDEVPLIIELPDGTVGMSWYYDVPDPEDVLEDLAEARR